MAISQEVGTWTLHSSFVRLNEVVATKTKVFSSGENSLFYLDKEDNSTHSLSKEDGLSGTDVTVLSYDEKTEIVYVGYRDGNIDLIYENLRVENINDIRRASSITGSKQINDFFTAGNLLYISTEFGVVVYDLVEKGVKESYRNIGPGGQEVSVTRTIFDDQNNRLYCQNNFGISTAEVGSNNLLNFENWEYYKDSLGNNVDYFSHIALLNQTLYTALSDDKIASRAIYKLEGSEFIKTNLGVVDWSEFREFKTVNERLVATFFFDAFSYDGENNTKRFNTSSVLSKATLDNENNYWVATENNGLATDVNNNTNANLSPSSPSSPDIFKFYSHGSTTLGLSGGYNGSFAPNFSGRGIYIYDAFRWNNINRDTKENYNFGDMVDAVYDPIKNRYFLASFIDGLIVWDTEDNFDKLTPADSSGIPFFTIDGQPKQTRISSVEIDPNNTLWITNHRTGASESIHSLNLANDTWTSYDLSSSGGQDPLDLVIDQSGTKWILAQGNSIIVWDDETSQEKRLNTQTGQGALPSSKINDIKLDKNNELWVGTDQGVAVFQNLDEALSSSFYECFLPIFEQRPLLQDETVNAVAIDGANRKWFGTTNGAFLFNENATDLIAIYTTENSLLPSNSINSISVNEETGEVFFGTEKGIASFWGDATEPKEDFGNAKIFPNPIAPNFDGFVTINGLKETSFVKITDIAGSLIYEKEANGGTVTWNTLKLDGERAQTGVYLVYSSDAEFEESFIGKIVINN